MKLSNLLLFAGAAAGSYFVVKNRQAIQDEVLDTTDRVEAIRMIWISSKTACKSSTNKSPYQGIPKDLTYKFKVLEKISRLD